MTLEEETQSRRVNLGKQSIVSMLFHELISAQPCKEQGMRGPGKFSFLLFSFPPILHFFFK